MNDEWGEAGRRAARKFTLGVSRKPSNPDCPACGHGWEVHEAGLPRLMFCLDCGCVATVKWRHAWIVWLLWAGTKLLRAAQGE